MLGPGDPKPLTDVQKASSFTDPAARQVVAVLFATAVCATLTVVRIPIPPVVLPEAPLPPLPPSEPFDAVGVMVDDPCAEGRCMDERQVWVDYTSLGVPGMLGGEWVSYDYAEVVRPVTARELKDEPEISLAVRLIVSETGADRLLTSRQALLESVGILETVRNRMDRTIYDVENMPNAPSFPGCGKGASFYSCANASQYLGMATWRALDPEKHYAPDVLAAATDVAVAAYWVYANRLIPDVTEGATNYVHRCGGAAYGMSTPHCDAHMGAPQGDVRGANPFTGPIVFKGPTVWYPAMGVYGIAESHRFEYDPWWTLQLVPDPEDALAEVDGGDTGVGRDLATKYALVPSEPRFDVDPIAADAVGFTAIDTLGPATDPAVLEHLASWAAYGHW